MHTAVRRRLSPKLVPLTRQRRYALSLSLSLCPSLLERGDPL